MIEQRALRIIGFFLVAALVIFWFARPKRTKVALVEAGILPPGADARVQGVRLLQSGPQGDLALDAHDAEWSREEQRFVLNTVDIRFREEAAGDAAEEGSGGRITAERGHASTSGKEFDLAGKVVAETFDGYRLVTSDVRYDHGTREATTRADVTLTGPGLEVTGRGAQVDYEDQRVTIRGRVRAHLVPAVLEENAPEGIDLEAMKKAGEGIEGAPGGAGKREEAPR